MEYEFSRTELLIGKKAVQKLSGSTVAVFGIGGVGSFAAEALVRSGIGTLILIDHDLICITNINRQIHADHNTVGKPKVEIMKERCLSINPRANVIARQIFCEPDNIPDLLSSNYDYIIDAMDTVTAKIDLILNARGLGIPLISCMGTGNKLDPSRFVTADIYDTAVCPLAKVMRKELRKRGIEYLKVVYSPEAPVRPNEIDNLNYLSDNIFSSSPPENNRIRRAIPGSIAFVPPAAGLMLAGEVVRDLISIPATNC